MADETALPPATTTTTKEPRKQNGMRDFILPMVMASARQGGPMGAMAAMMGVPYMQRGAQGKSGKMPGGAAQYYDPRSVYASQLASRNAYQAELDKFNAPKKEDPALPPYDPAQAAASALTSPAAAPTAAPATLMGHADATGGSTLADMFGGKGSSRLVNGANKSVGQGKLSALRFF